MRAVTGTAVRQLRQLWQPIRRSQRQVERSLCTATAPARTPVTVYTEDEESIREMVTRFNAVSDTRNSSRRRCELRASPRRLLLVAEAS